MERALRDVELTPPERGTGSGPAAVSGPGGMFIGPLAGALGIRPATLRK